MSGKDGPRSACVEVDGPALRASICEALAADGFVMAGMGAELLVCAAGEGGADLSAMSGLAPAAIDAIQSFAKATSPSAPADRSVVLLGGPGGPHSEALLGAVRALAHGLAPGLRVNGVAPAREGDALSASQTAAAVVYLAKARVVTGQLLRVTR